MFVFSILVLVLICFLIGGGNLGIFDKSWSVCGFLVYLIYLKEVFDLVMILELVFFVVMVKFFVSFFDVRIVDLVICKLNLEKIVVYNSCYFEGKL